MPRLKHPVTGFVRDVNDARARELRLRGYKDEHPQPDDGPQTRSALNERAREAGVESPEKLPNKQAVIDAINAA